MGQARHFGAVLSAALSCAMLQACVPYAYTESPHLTCRVLDARTSVPVVGTGSSMARQADSPGHNY